ncbi:hypothetical protein AXG93_473s1050 [Marchantia polymorpha subsp. ruderalis]|uniref:Uncharacterized protein n=1 Tax=Marchantia polymorpha subsp. ruderalis TaxID=1480154 RepID=A0A176W2D3_MARPO|nr:hypothetical protein AXG93_473s1050 [Marchantia polymorpha subsp. ruderalis]
MLQETGVPHISDTNESSSELRSQLNFHEDFDQVGPQPTKCQSSSSVVARKRQESDQDEENKLRRDLVYEHEDMGADALAGKPEPEPPGRVVGQLSNFRAACRSPARVSRQPSTFIIDRTAPTTELHRREDEARVGLFTRHRKKSRIVTPARSVHTFSCCLKLATRETDRANRLRAVVQPRRLRRELAELWLRLLEIRRRPLAAPSAGRTFGRIRRKGRTEMASTDNSVIEGPADLKIAAAGDERVFGAYSGDCGTGGKLYHNILKALVNNSPHVSQARVPLYTNRILQAVILPMQPSNAFPEKR